MKSQQPYVFDDHLQNKKQHLSTDEVGWSKQKEPPIMGDSSKKLVFRNDHLPK